MGRKIITVYEHSKLTLNTDFTSRYLKRLEEFHGEGDSPYFDLIYRGVKFKSHVGVLQVDDLTIEILPKVDRPTEVNQENKWRDFLIVILKRSGIIDIKAPSSSNLALTKNNILYAYFELYMNEVEKLLHDGLIKRYRLEEGNLGSLRGRLKLAKNIEVNHIHKERLYCEYSSYDSLNTLNKIIYKTIRLIKRVNNSHLLASRVENLMLNFPEMEDLRVTESTFSSIKFDRKSERYRKAMVISELLLLNYHPDIKAGKKYVLALMFDMNVLWERYIYTQLSRLTKNGYTIKGQLSKHFWGSNKNKRFIKPDIVVTKDNQRYILDTKWKVLENGAPDIKDIQQMFSYNMLFDAEKSILLYPKVKRDTMEREKYVPKRTNEKESFCQVAYIDIFKADGINNNIANDIEELLKS